MSDRRSDRRGFLRLLANEVGRGVREAAAEAAEAAGIGDPEPVAEEALAPAEQAILAAAPPPEDPPPERTPLEREAFGLAADLGLSARLGAVDQLMRRSLRLTGTDAPPGRSHLGGTADLPEDVRRPVWSGGELTHVVQIDLAEAAELPGHDGVLPGWGLLWVFFDLERAPRGTRADEALAVRVLDGDAPDAAAADPARRPLALSEELALPPASAQAVQLLALGEAEHAAWEDLRERLAEGRPAAPHRILGYPDEDAADMPLTCELLSRGADLGDRPATEHPRRAEAEPDAGRWRLLLQLSLDEDTGLPSPPAARRLYLWIPEPDLAAADFSRVRALLR